MKQPSYVTIEQLPAHVYGHCHHCDKYLVPGDTAHIVHHPGRGIAVFYCSQKHVPAKLGFKRRVR